jgi:glycosyltransferase involved in cell wall biosynthesis
MAEKDRDERTGELKLYCLKKISVIISIYNRLDNLELILLGLERQTVKPLEVIVSEDNNSPETIQFIENARKRFTFPLKHVSQEDVGFRKTMALNKAVVASEGNYLIFLDGDCIPHEKFVEVYGQYLDRTTVCVARRCYLDKSLTEKLYRTKNLKLLSVFNILFHAKRLGHAFYTSPAIKKPKLSRRSRSIIGCNWAVYKQNVLDVNGYDEDYRQAGEGEDFDIDWRLRRLNSNIIFLNLKHQAITYHLYHAFNYSMEDAVKSRKMKFAKIEAGHFVCKNGIRKIQ